jgi:hypothetical protein
MVELNNNKEYYHLDEILASLNLVLHAQVVKYLYPIVKNSSLLDRCFRLKQNLDESNKALNRNICIPVD